MESNISSRDLGAHQASFSSQGKEAPYVLWLTGLSGSGKSTLAYAIRDTLTNSGQRVHVLDGDNLRASLCSDLGFSDEDRLENIRRASDVARILVDAGVIVIAAFISPLKLHRDLARSKFNQHEFAEIYCRSSIETCKKRDVKGHYAEVRLGRLKNFTGIDGIYEEPISPELVLDTEATEIDECLDEIFLFLKKTFNSSLHSLS